MSNEFTTDMNGETIHTSQLCCRCSEFKGEMQNHPDEDVGGFFLCNFCVGEILERKQRGDW